MVEKIKEGIEEVLVIPEDLIVPVVGPGPVCLDQRQKEPWTQDYGQPCKELLSFASRI